MRVSRFDAVSKAHDFEKFAEGVTSSPIDHAATSASLSEQAMALTQEQFTAVAKRIKTDVEANGKRADITADNSGNVQRIDFVNDKIYIERSK